MEKTRRHKENQDLMNVVQSRPTGKPNNGLKNEGATCYLNSVLQCLYMTEEFREAVENFSPDPPNSDEKNTVLMLELQNLFKKMKHFEGTTEEIIKILCIRNVCEQQDAVEYYQKILKAIGPQVSKIFEGKMSNNTKCSNNHKFQEKCDFYTIPLPIEAEHNGVFKLQEGLQTFLKLSKLDEDNWLYCDYCGQKNETEIWNEIEECPTILALYPKRFYFDYNQWRPMKNHCPMDISLQLKLNFNIRYELYAVINHLGEESGGHYNAVIKSFDDGKWYCFDDSSVTQDSESSFHYSTQAYLLMYRKVDEKSISELHCQEYCRWVTMLLKWISDHISLFDDSKIPTTDKEIEIFCRQFLGFRAMQMPEKKSLINRSKHVYRVFKDAVHPGQISIPPGYNPTDVEKEWHQLHEVIRKRDNLFRNKFQWVYSSLYNKYYLCYTHNLLALVEEIQGYIQNSEWGADLPSIESQLGRHNIFRQFISDLKYKIAVAKAVESQIRADTKHTYTASLSMLISQYNKLVNSSEAHLQNPNNLHEFAVDATNELMWLSKTKEEEEKYDWSDDNTNMAVKKDNFSALVRDLEERMQRVNAMGNRLLKEGLPAQHAIEKANKKINEEERRKIAEKPNIWQEPKELKKLSDQEIKHKSQQEQESLQSQNKTEEGGKKNPTSTGEN